MTKWGDYNRVGSSSYVHRWPVHKRPDDYPHWWCVCDEPQPKPCGPFGVAMGGLQECASCHCPIIGSESSNPLGPTPTLIALTTGQRLVFAVVALIFVVVFVVWPVVHPRVTQRERDDHDSRRRLLDEIRRHTR